MQAGSSGGPGGSRGTKSRAGKVASAAADCTSQTSVRKEGTQHGQGTMPGFKFRPRGVSAPATRAAGPDWRWRVPSIESEQQQDAHTAVGPRELEQDKGTDHRELQGSSFTGPVYQTPGAAGPGGGDTSGHNSERSCATDISHDGSPSEHRPRGCQISVLSRARKYSRRARAGGPLGAPLLRVYLPTAEATKNGGAGLDL